MNKKELFAKKIELRHNLYKSFLIHLPFGGIKEIALIFSSFRNRVEKGFINNFTDENSLDLIRSFFKNQKIPKSKIKDYLFKFIQILEREITLFDAIEDAMFQEINEASKENQGALSYFLNKVDKDWKLTDLYRHLENYKIRIVLTAHPTQFYPVYILNIIEELSLQISNKNIENINSTLKQLAYSSFLNKKKPTPFEEANSIVIFLKKIFYEVISDIEWEIESKIKNNLPEKKYPARLKPLIEIGFWPGGDRDGNPFVTHETTKKVALLLKEAIIKCYINDLKVIKKKLTFKLIYDKIDGVMEKLKNILTDSKLRSEKYPVDFLERDLQDVIQILIAHYDSLFLDLVEKFYKKVKSFGYHFANLDLRQHNQVHAKAIKEIVCHFKDFSFYEKYQEASLTQKLQQLNDLQETMLEQKIDITKAKGFSELTLETLKTIEQFFILQRSNGERAINRYIISNCDKASDLLEVFFLFNFLKPQGENLKLDLIPLFESIDSLTNASQIMNDLYAVEAYREHLKNRNNEQTIMLGYSDGTKDGGYLAANWSIYKAKEDLTRISQENGLEVIFFDGRGGPPSRGGGNTNKFYNSLSDKINNKEIQLTIQGQTISSNFGSRVAAKFNLEQLFIAGLESKMYFNQQNQIKQKHRDLLNLMAKTSNRKYLDLISHPEFTSYLAFFTPINFFGKSNIGSRPAKRNDGQEIQLKSLRAIPFVSSWNQIKQNIPAFYGLGSSLWECEKQEGLGILIDLYKNSLFFRALLGNTAQSLLKTNFNLTTYIREIPRHGKLWEELLQEKELTEAMILKITEKKELLLDSPINRQSILLREKIVQPLLVIQQYAIANLYYSKQGEVKISSKDLQAYEKIIIRSLAGIINAARNSA